MDQFKRQKTESCKNSRLIADFEKIRERCVGNLWNSPQNEKYVCKAISELKSDGDTLYFCDVNYECTSASAWNNAQHLVKLSNLINAYGKERLKNDEQARKTVISILDYWLKNDFFCKVNWWYNEIEVPRYIAGIGLRLKEWLSEKQINKMDEIIGRGTLKGSEKAATYTGANLTDMMYATVLHGIFIEDCELILKAALRVANEIKVSKGNGEGIQCDGSYFQHGNLLCCAGSYGTVFVEGIGFFVTTLYGTEFSLPEEKIRIFIDNILDGQRYFHRGFGTAYFSIGRSAVYADGAWRLQLWADKLSKLDGVYRQKELQAYVKTFSDFSLLPNVLKYFPCSYTLTAFSPEYFMGVRGAHENIVLTEVINRQNILGYNLSYGSNTCYMYYGDEYGAIGAVMDFCMFPGTTAYAENDSELLSRYDSDYNITWGKETYKGTHCAGKTDEKTGIGVLYTELKNDGIGSMQTFVIYDGFTVVLGSGLNCSKEENTKEIRTVLDQCKFSSASLGNEQLTLNSGEITVPSSLRVSNGAFAYYNLSDGVLKAVAETKQGSYSRTDSAKPEVTQSADVFSLYISHGTEIKNSSYAYGVFANGKGNAPLFAENLPVSEIINTKEVQGVLFENGHYALAFHKAASVTFKNGITVNYNKPGIVIN